MTDNLQIRDFTPTKENISLHGLGFIQLKLPNNSRMHFWHPELPKRKCYDNSPIHNHRFSFTSKVIKGTQINTRYNISLVTESEATHEILSHNGKRLSTGSRLTYPVAYCKVYKQSLDSFRQFIQDDRPKSSEVYQAGEQYETSMYDYHKTTPGGNGIVITMMKKLNEGTIHANSIIKKGCIFDTEFDRFQLSEDELFDYVKSCFLS